MIPIYSVYDELTGFLGPIKDTNDEVAKRNFSYMVNNSKEYQTNAKDFALYRLGDFDPASGNIVALPVPALLIRATDCF